MVHTSEECGERNIKDLCWSMNEHNGSKSGSLASIPNHVFFWDTSSLTDWKEFLDMFIFSFQPLPLSFWFTLRMSSGSTTERDKAREMRKRNVVFFPSLLPPQFSRFTQSLVWIGFSSSEGRMKHWPEHAQQLRVFSSFHWCNGPHLSSLTAPPIKHRSRKVQYTY